MKAACSVCTLDPAGAKVNGLNGRTPVPAREEEQKRTFPFERGKKESKLDHLGYESATEAILLLWVASCCHHLGCGRVSKWLTGSGDHSLSFCRPSILFSFFSKLFPAFFPLCYVKPLLSNPLIFSAPPLSGNFISHGRFREDQPPSAALHPRPSSFHALPPLSLSLPLSPPLSLQARTIMLCTLRRLSIRFRKQPTCVLCRHFLLEIMIKDGCVFQVRHSSLPFFLFLLSQRHFFLGRIERAAFFLFPSG